jgi:Arc/MetJ-type ribon-helix-helix transcriptional regulator
MNAIPVDVSGQPEHALGVTVHGVSSSLQMRKAICMTSQNETVSVPPALAAEILAVANEEHRDAADVVREALENYLEFRRWERHANLDRAREFGLPDDGVPLTAEYRLVIREKIAQGLRSLREGRGVDGEAFMAQMDAELAELERQEHQ